MFSLKNKIILITGASSGIGEAIAHRCARDGARLILVARRDARLNHLSKELKDSTGCESLTHQLDITNKEGVKNFISNLPDAWSHIDVLVNNAGLALTSDPIQSADEDNWDTMIDTNVKGLLYISRSIVPGMIVRNSGHVVNIGSIAGQYCYPNGNVYSATKYAVRAISESMRLDFSGTKLRVTEIRPGAVETEFSKVRWKDEDRARAFYQDFNPLLAEDIADAVHYCITRPSHVDIAEMTIMPTDQAAASVISRKGRDEIKDIR